MNSNSNRNQNPVTINQNHNRRQQTFRRTVAKLEGVSGGEAADGGYGKPRLDLGLVHPRVGLSRVWNLQLFVGEVEIR